MPKKTTTKKTVAKKPAAKKTVAKKTATKKVSVAEKKRVENIYFWSGLAIALCAAGAFMILAFGIGSMIR